MDATNENAAMSSLALAWLSGFPFAAQCSSYFFAA
jgi:hypothetical protein